MAPLVRSPGWAPTGAPSPAPSRPPSWRPSKRPRLHPARAKDEGSPDLIESLVGKLFGRAALEDRAPAGMKRLDNPESESRTANPFYTLVTDSALVSQCTLL